MADQIYLVRHGETEWSLSGQHTSYTDLPLTEHGREQARAVADKLAGIGFSLVLSSPLQRARETCRLAGFGQAAELTDDLREWNYGDYEGVTTAEIHERDPDWLLWRDGCPGGESPAEIGARLDRLLSRLAGVDGDVLCFAHGHVLRVLTARWLEMEVAAGARFALATATVSVLGHEHATQVVERWSA
jgi:broad specificity phosphatase PhoE